MSDGADFRIEHDTMGEVRVPADALWRAQTQRAVENFPISGRGLERAQIRALGLVKGAAARVNGRILWANLHLLFWLSLVPFTTGWMGENHFAPLPTAVYGAVLLMAGVAYLILAYTIVAENGPDSQLAQALGRDRKGKLSLVLYAIAIPLAFVNQWISDAIYVAVAAIWLVPDPRIEGRLKA